MAISSDTELAELASQDQITSLFLLLCPAERKPVFAKFGSRQLAQNCHHPRREI